MNASKRIRPFFSYFGAKWNIAPKYPAPRFDTLIEWYAGSAQYALLHHERDVVLIEAYAPVADLWRYLIGATEDEIMSLPDLPAGVTVRDLGLAPGPSALIGYWCNSAPARPRQSMVARALLSREQYKKMGCNPLFWGTRVRERIASQLHAIRHWQVFEGRVEDFCPGDIEATHFVDPPYEKAGHAYGVSGVDYVALSSACRSARGQVIACEALGASWLPFRFLADAKATSRAGARVSSEVVWCT